MKKLHFLYAAAISMTLGLGFTACGDDDEPGANAPSVVNPTVPSQLGWSTGSDGKMYYTVENTADYEDGECNSYFALSQKNDKVTEAVFTVVAANNAYASEIGRLLTSGAWATEDEADAPAKVRKARAVAHRLGNNLMQTIRSLGGTRAGLILPVPCSVSGNCIYVTIDKFNGLAVAKAQNVINYWNDNADVYPDQFIFGTWNGTVYECKNMGGIGITYKVETAFDADNNCTKYVTTITCPNASWATVMKAEMDEQAAGFQELFGRAPQVSANGNSVTVEAAIVDKVDKETIEGLLMDLEWINNTPFLYNVFS